MHLRGIRPMRGVLATPPRQRTISSVLLVVVTDIALGHEERSVNARLGARVVVDACADVHVLVHGDLSTQCPANRLKHAAGQNLP